MHSKIVGGSTAKRVMACPGSVALSLKMPPKPSSSYADEGTLLHSAISAVLDGQGPVLGMTYEGVVLTQELIDSKLTPSLDALDTEVDPDQMMTFDLEAVVDFGKWLPGVFGSADLLGRIGDKAIVLDWKFGDGVPVSAEENEQLMFYAAAAMRTEKTQWVFNGATEIELIIVQNGAVSRWMTTPERIRTFELALKRAVKAAAQPDAKLQVGDHCRWCPAKPICPLMTGAVDRALKTQIVNLDKPTIGKYLKNADLLEDWIKDLRGLAVQIMETGEKIPGYKMVQKQARRKWTDEGAAKLALIALGLTESEVTEVSLLSPAQAEKVLKKHKLSLPEDFIACVSSGTTFAPEDDPRPEVMQLGKQLAALSKLQ